MSKINIDSIDDWEELQSIDDEDLEEEEYIYEMIDYREEFESVRQLQSFDIVMNGIICGILLMLIMFNRLRQ